MTSLERINKRRQKLESEEEDALQEWEEEVRGAFGAINGLLKNPKLSPNIIKSVSIRVGHLATLFREIRAAPSVNKETIKEIDQSLRAVQEALEQRAFSNRQDIAEYIERAARLSASIDEIVRKDISVFEKLKTA